jgi:flagellum-specific ATP synthase
MLELDLDFNKLIKKVNNISTIYSEGIVKKVIGLTIEVQVITAFVGELSII